ncbi:SURF1 family protein [Marinicella meishanensis]|uniref:SURF1 family protein n=1 Tax=Marinicella meishanensis TaxID=2873263 RepID=UPI001CBE46C3|nr:SURF1 family protein [Marinicella sp. NBU2979]
MRRRFPWLFTALWLMIFCLMVWAGFWQLGRAEEKRVINERLADKQWLRPQTDAEWQRLQPFNRIETWGEYHPTHLLLANQIIDGQVGYFVFTAMQTQSQQWLLVNRGWQPEAALDLDIESGPQLVRGLIGDWPRPGVQLGEQTIQHQAQQTVTYLPQAPTVNLIKQRHCANQSDTKCEVLPQVLKLDPAMDHGFVRAWQLPRMTVAKHQAYAAQWFTMAVVLCLVYGLFIRKQMTRKQDAS